MFKELKRSIKSGESREYLAVESGEGVCHISVPDPHPSFSTLPRPAVGPGSHQHASCLLASGWSHSVGSMSRRRGRRRERSEILFPQPPPCRISARWPCPLSEGLAAPLSLRILVLFPLACSSNCHDPWPQGTTLSLVVFPLPTNTLSTVFLLNSLHITQFEHIICFLLDYGWWEVTYNKVGETLTQRKSTSIPKISLWSPKPSRYPEEALVRDLPSSSLSSIPSLVPGTSFQLLF